MKLLLRFYQIFISPALHLVFGPGNGCRFEPTCSQYSIEALREHGSWKGGILSLRRILRCHPGCSPGFDPVPRAISAGKSIFLK